MAKYVIVYVGWIGGRESDREALEKLGVKLGSHDREITWGGCEVSERALENLEKHWRSKFLWGLRRTVRTEYNAPKPGEDDDIPF